MTPRVTIVGAGNLGLAISAVLSSKRVPVTLYTSKPERWNRTISVVEPDGRIERGELAAVTSDPKVAADADLVFLCLPGNVIEAKLAELAPYLAKGTPIGSVFCADGFFFLSEKILGADWPTMGFQRVPFICRTKEPYRIGGITGRKKELFLAVRNLAQSAEYWRAFYEHKFETPTALLDNFYEAALANSNPVIHPARLMSLKRQIEMHGPFSRMPLFYEEWDDVASECAIELDNELRSVATSKGAVLVPFLEYYEANDVPSLTRKIRSISAFKGISSPITPAGELDYNSRYITADIFVSVRIIIELAEVVGVKTPRYLQIQNSFMR